MAVDYPTYHERMRATFGLRASKAPPCPRVVVGRRCLRGYGPRGRQCICEGFYHELFDHGVMWLDAAGRHVLTGEPYGFDPATLARFLGRCAIDELAVHVEQLPGLWSPAVQVTDGTTLLIVRADV